MTIAPSLLDNANHVLMQSFWDKSKAGDPSLNIPKSASKNHWSFYLLGIGALAAAVAIIAGAIISQVGLIIGGIFYTLATSIGAYYVHRFGSEQIFEKYVQIFTERVRQITQDVQSLLSDNEHLKSELSGS